MTEPDMVIIGRFSAVLPMQFGKEDGERVVDRWRTVAVSHIVQLSDIDEPVMGKRPKKRG